MNTPRLGQLCLSCLHASKPQTGTCTVISKRFRYYWEARPECRERKKLMMITVPRLTERKDEYNFKKRVAEQKLYGMDVILHKEVQEIFRNSKMIAACLYADQYDDDYYYVRYELQQHGMNMEKYDRHIMRFTLEGTPYRHMLKLFDGPSTIIYGEPNVDKMIKAVKRNKHLLLIGGLVDGKFMSVKELTAYASLPGLDGCRSELSGILSSVVSSTYDLLKRPAASLASSLQQHETQNLHNNEGTDPG